MSAQDHAAAILFAQPIHHIGQALLRLVLPGGSIQGEHAPKAPVVEIRELERNQPQAHPPLPRFAQEL
jgi:hypothetical protein